MYELKEKYDIFMNDVITTLKKENYEVEILNDFSDKYLVVFINGKSFHISESSNAILNQFYSKYISLLIEPEKIENANSQYIFTKHQNKSPEEYFEIAINYLKSVEEIKEPLNLFIEKLEV